MATTPLFHGPAARLEAVAHAEEAGRMLAPPFGDEGLKVDAARDIVEILGAAPIGDRIGTVVIGPMDTATPDAADALLKVLEEFPESVLLPVLWAHDAGTVIGTVRSRCHEHWCPSEPGSTPEAPFVPTAKDLCEAALRRRTASVIETLEENKGSEEMLLRASAEVLATEDSWPVDARIKLWESLRDALNIRNPSSRQIVAAFLV